MYDNKQCNRFVKDMAKAGLNTEHYHGRFHWEGPAVRVDTLQDALSNTKIECQHDSMGLGFIVYPVEKGKVIAEPIGLTTKARLNTAFRCLRKAGYFAKQNHTCCQSCGWAEMTDEQGKKAVFYHAQDAEALDELGNIKPNDKLYLAWSGDGSEIVKILISAGLVIDWDGTSDNRIAVCGGAK